MYFGEQIGSIIYKRAGEALKIANCVDFLHSSCLSANRSDRLQNYNN